MKKAPFPTDFPVEEPFVLPVGFLIHLDDDGKALIQLRPGVERVTSGPAAASLPVLAVPRSVEETLTELSKILGPPGKNSTIYTVEEAGVAVVLGQGVWEDITKLHGYSLNMKHLLVSFSDNAVNFASKEKIFADAPPYDNPSLFQCRNAEIYHMMKLAPPGKISIGEGLEDFFDQRETPVFEMFGLDSTLLQDFYNNLVYLIGKRVVYLSRRKTNQL